MDHYILAINPGSTSTKIAVYKNEDELFAESIDHSNEDLARCRGLRDQFEMRRALVFQALEKHDFDKSRLSAAVGRGGQLPPVKAGGYGVNEAMKRRIIQGPIIDHASNLGALLAAAVAEPQHIPAYIYDAVSSDELKEVAKVTGIPEIVRQSFCHVLNSKATARKVAAQMGGRYEDMNFVVAHLGGGISISAHEKGKIVDVITDDAGPFSPERSGSVPILYIVDMCYSGEYSKKDLMKKLRGMGGLKAYLGTHDCRRIEAMIQGGDEKAKLLYQAQAYQISKGIGELSPTIDGTIDAVILTGGMAYSDMLTDMVSKRVSFIAPVVVYPGENELESLAYGALRILRGQEPCNEYVDNYQEKEELFI
ncbi:butyrate kinase [Bacilliculturomica massiliensis]|uniref:butyrate kinase n=1 Tax=Bacilliculturomica massiliensis TaxID=1917867 RepID=UPI0010306290|nr:butyrate kinase [Bacilliculturomica massiliensis]